MAESTEFDKLARPEFTKEDEKTEGLLEELIPPLTSRPAEEWEPPPKSAAKKRKRHGGDFTSETSKKAKAEYYARLKAGDPTAKPPGPKHGIRGFLSTGRIRSPRIRNAVNDYVKQTVEQLGGISNLHVGQIAVILTQRVCLTVILLAEESISKEMRVISPTGDPAAGVKLLTSYMTSFRNGQKALGLDRKPKPEKEKSLADILKEIGEKKNAETQGTAAPGGEGPEVLGPGL